METYQVNIYPSAQQDLEDIVDYLNTLSPELALEYFDRIVTEISKLDHMPYRFAQPRDLALAAKGYRHMLVGAYLVFYVVIEKEVQIRRILYAKSDYLQLL